jgi:glycosyltransferase involved in cell wall biosynthesis
VTQTLSRSTIVGLPSAHVTTMDIPGCRPLDVLIVTSEAPPIISGISTCIERLASGLTQRGHRIRVLSSTQIPRFTLGEWRLSSFLAYWPRIARELKHFDVVNVHGPVPTMSDAFLRLSNLLPPHARPAIVYTHHSPIDIRSATRMSARYNKLHESLALRADRIVTSSQYYATQHRSRYGPLVRAIPWGVDARASAQTFVPRSAEKLRVLFVGQMRPYKGVETLLAAVAGQPWLELTLVGKGTELANYQRLADRLSVTNAQFMGRVSDSELDRQYGAHDVVVLPSVTRAEAFGLVLLEGMAAGCVPVASDLPGVRDVAGPTGVIVPPRDPLALRQALRELADDEARLKHLQLESWLAARTRTWERCVTSYEEVLVDAVRCRYARVNGFAVLPEVDEEDSWQPFSDPYAIPVVKMGVG